MKLFGIFLLTGYFLARENEMFSGPEKKLPALWRSTGIYFLCAAAAVGTGLLWSLQIVPSGNQIWQPAAMFAAAALPAFFLSRRPAAMIGGAFTAFWALHWTSRLGLLAAALFYSSVAVLMLQFFYQGAYERMQRLNLPPAVRKGPARLLLLFALALLFAFVFEKAVQIL